VLQLLIFRNKPRKGATGSMHQSLLLFCVPILCARELCLLFSTTYGINADNFINAEFVNHSGSLFNLNEISSPNLYSYKNLQHKDSPGICVSASIRLHPVTDDEKGILVPFETLNNALIL